LRYHVTKARPSEAWTKQAVAFLTKSLAEKRLQILHGVFQHLPERKKVFAELFSKSDRFLFL
jgi:hypothetical protein